MSGTKPSRGASGGVQNGQILPLDEPVTGHEMRGWWNDTRFFGAEMGPDWREANAYWWIAVDTFRQTKPPDATIYLEMIAVTGPYPARSWTVAKVTL